MTQYSILWENLEKPGHEAAFLYQRDGSGLELEGVAVFLHEQLPCHLRYAVKCDLVGNTVLTTVNGRVAENRIEIEIVVKNGRWYLNGAIQEQIASCRDIDLHFSPATNTLPIHRAKLSPDQRINTSAAWLKFPDFTLEPLQQTYTCLTESDYRYESAGGAFISNITVNQIGFVTNYPGLWRAVGSHRC